MCWSMGASLAMAGLGVGATGYLIVKGKPATLWAPMGFFTVMELLQAASYPVIGQCGHPVNETLSWASFVHITFHPLAFSLIYLAFLPSDFASRIKWPVVAVSLLAGLATLSMIYPFPGAGACDPRRMMCGENVCTYMGNLHLAWQFPLNGYGNSFRDNGILWLARDGLIAYQLVVFYIPLLYGAWRLAAYFLVTGPLLARLLTDNVDEQPAIWCLLSVALLVAIITPPLRRFLTVKQEPWWVRRFWPAVTDGRGQSGPRVAS
ncbi:DUF5765 domain-containing protein [Yoonia sp. BS5-3]|uniref:DUF5765 domain-containing protein n=1 Tax=Yoonia phaeophyticola TaxID=3137369 RepID=A0ABZ2V7R8_9RHOB